MEPNCSKEVKSSNDGAWEPRDRRRSVVAHFMIIWDTAHSARQYILLDGGEVDSLTVTESVLYGCGWIAAAEC